jgi:opacity protein-like surface antigen
VKALLACALFLAASPAWAQRSEVALLAGYATAGNIDSAALGIRDLAIDGGFAWGLEAGHFFTPHLGVEVSWVRQESALAFTSAGTPVELFDLNASQWHGSVAYQFGADGGRLRPFVTGGLGVTTFDATDLDGETKLALTVGAGLKWFPWDRFGVRLQGRYVPTFLDDASSDFCDPFGFCQSWLHQLDLHAGVAVRF